MVESQRYSKTLCFPLSFLVVHLHNKHQDLNLFVRFVIRLSSVYVDYNSFTKCNASQIFIRSLLVERDSH